MADSFCLIPSKSESPLNAFQRENTSLRAEIDVLQKQLASAEGMLKMRQEQDQQLRDSILLARKEVSTLVYILEALVDTVCRRTVR